MKLPKFNKLISNDRSSASDYKHITMNCATYRDNTSMYVNEIKRSLVEFNNLTCALYNTVRTRDMSVESLLKGLVDYVSTEGIMNVIKDILIRIKNFLMKIISGIIAFFKRMFDCNTKTRATINKAMSEYLRRQSKEGNLRINNLTLTLASFSSTVNLMRSLSSLYGDIIEASKATNIKTMITFRTGLTVLGIPVVDNVIDFNASTRTRLNIVASSFSAGSAEWGWDMDKFMMVSNELCTLCVKTEELNSLKTKLENEISATRREIDRLTVIGDNETATKMQGTYLDLCDRVSYISHSITIFQEYITLVSTQLTDAWTNILEVL